MPLILKEHIKPEGIVGVWRIDEEADFFKSKMQLSIEEENYLSTLKGKRPIEWLASRYLVHELSERKIRGKLIKDEFGKPHLESSPYFISLSHSRNLVAVIASPQKVGIDIQIFVEKISRLESKFANQEEVNKLSENYRLEELHIIWGAKEAMYKAFGRKEVDFKKHMHVKGFAFKRNSIILFDGALNKPSYNYKFHLISNCFNNYFLVYAIEK